jgi:predicted phosphodiesterase
MKIALYSDLHLEFGPGWAFPGNLDADILVLAGDIIVFDDFGPLKRFLGPWDKPVIYVPGNHEYYTQRPMKKHNQMFRKWLAQDLPQVRLLLNEGLGLGGINFFGGTMWTDFKGGDKDAMRFAPANMGDFHLIFLNTGFIKPWDMTRLHREFKTTLELWFRLRMAGPRVVITHHAPVENPKTKYGESGLQPAFLCYDMADIIDEFHPALWIYGHTHECDNRIMGRTRVISNQRGYLSPYSGYLECEGEFDEGGCIQEL